MTVGEFKEIIENVPDHFTFEVEVEKAVGMTPTEKTYNYPYISERCITDKNYYDVGWSDQKIFIGVRITKL